MNGRIFKKGFMFLAVTVLGMTLTGCDETTLNGAKLYSCPDYFNNGQNNDELETVLKTSDGGYVMAGVTDQNAVGGFVVNTLWLVKVDCNGDAEWNKAVEYDGADSIESDGIRDANSVKLLEGTNGEIIVVGSIYFNEGYFEGLAMRLSATGDIVWQKRYQSATDEFDSVMYQSVTQVYNSNGAADGFLLTGEIIAGAPNRMIIAKIAENGNMEWQYVMDSTLDRMNVRSVLKTSTGDYLAAVQFGSNPVVMKFHVSGNTVAVDWSKTYQTAAGNVRLKNMKKLANNQYLLLGEYWKSNTDYDGWTMIIDEAGSIIREMSYHMAYPSILYDAYQTSDKSLLITGYIDDASEPEAYHGEDMVILKVNSSGAVLWEGAYNYPNRPFYNGTDIGIYIEELSDARIVVAGLVSDYDNGWDYAMMRTDNDGKFSNSKITVTRGTPSVTVESVNVTANPLPGWIALGVNTQDAPFYMKTTSIKVTTK